MTDAPVVRLIHILPLLIIVLVTAWSESARVIVGLLAECARLGPTELALHVGLPHHLLLPLILILVPLHDEV